MEERRGKLKHLMVQNPTKHPMDQAQKGIPKTNNEAQQKEKTLNLKHLPPPFNPTIDETQSLPAKPQPPISSHKHPTLLGPKPATSNNDD